MSFTQKFNYLYSSLDANNSRINDLAAELCKEDVVTKNNNNQKDTTKTKGSPETPSKPKSNAKEVVDKILKLMNDNAAITKAIFETLKSIMENMSNTIFDTEGNFLKVGVLKWKNIPKYAEFAKFAKNSIENLVKEIQ